MRRKENGNEAVTGPVAIRGGTASAHPNVRLRQQVERRGLKPRGFRFDSGGGHQCCVGSVRN